MIPIIENIVKSCDTKDALSEIGFLAGILVAGYGIYTCFKDTSNTENVESGLIAASTGSVFIIGSYIVRNIDGSCAYQYED